MTEFHIPQEQLPHIPDNLTIGQFMLDYQHGIQPTRGMIPCLVDDDTGLHISLETMKSRTNNLANGLSLEYQLNEADTVMLVSPNHVDYPVAIWAIHRLGGIVTCSNPLSKANELSYQLTTSKANFMVVHSTVIDIALDAASTVGLPLNRVILLDQPLPSLGLSELCTLPGLIFLGQHSAPAFYERSLEAGEGKTKIALLCWSSGTTGKPKAVEIPHAALIANIIQMAAHNQVEKAFGYRESQSYRPGDVALGVLPFYHVAGLVITLHFTLFCAMTLVVVPKYDFLAMLESITRYQISHLFLVPPQATAFSKHPVAIECNHNQIKYIMIGAAPVSREVQRRLYELFPSAQIGQAYGLTEMTTTLAMVTAKQTRAPLGSGGRLLPGIRARVVKPDGSEARYGEKGELVVKGPTNALGYFNDPEATADTFVDGWVRTGDEVILTSDQEVFVCDRLKELLKVRGFQVAPAELEGCLLSHPDVSDVCVVGIPDEYSGELPMAYVVLSEAAEKCINLNASMTDFYCESIIKHVEDRKTGFKHLAGGVRFVSSIPKNGSGKMLRRVLREHARQNPRPKSRSLRMAKL